MIRQTTILRRHALHQEVYRYLVPKQRWSPQPTQTPCNFVAPSSFTINKNNTATSTTQYRSRSSFSTSSSSTSGTNEPFYGAPRSANTIQSNLSPFQRCVLAIHSATTVFTNPERGDALASLGEVTGHIALSHMHDRMMSDPTGQLVLTERPLVNHDSVKIEQWIQEYEANKSNGRTVTFGQTYAKFMQQHGFDPEGRSDVHYISDPELAYVMLRYRQCHDFWHALCDLPPTVLGELALKWVELLQTGLPVAALSATVGSLRLSWEEQHLLWNVYYPWAIQMGTQATFLMNVYYEHEFETDIHVLRRRLGIIPAPNV